MLASIVHMLNQILFPPSCIGFHFTVDVTRFIQLIANKNKRPKTEGTGTAATLMSDV